MKAGLYLIGTPIGNLEDISQRALNCLKEADIILAEDTRHTYKLLMHYGIKAQTISCHKFNEASRIHLVIQNIKAGKAVALVSNAGMPTISDPGSRIVKACRKEGLFISAIPGPSAVTMAMALSGFCADRYVFAGFLPATSAAREKTIRNFLAHSLPVVFFESPYRIMKLMEDLRKIVPEREIFVGRELTKINEECLCGKVDDIASIMTERSERDHKKLKGEFVLVLSCR